MGQVVYEMEHLVRVLRAAATYIAQSENLQDNDQSPRVAGFHNIVELL